MNFKLFKFFFFINLVFFAIFVQIYSLNGAVEKNIFFLEMEIN